MTAPGRPDNGHDEGHRNLSEPGNGRCSCGAKAQPGEYIPTWWRQHSQAVAANERRREQECSATCNRRVCEWCPGQDRYEAAAQRLYTMVIARQEGIPTDDVTPWSDLTAFKRNGWRRWLDELLALLGQDGSETDGGERRG